MIKCKKFHKVNQKKTPKNHFSRVVPLCCCCRGFIFPTLPLFLIPLCHFSYYHYPNTTKLIFPFRSPYCSIKTPNPNLSKYPKPLHIPKQNSPYNPCSHCITPLLILPCFIVPLDGRLSKQPLASPLSKGQPKYSL